MVDELIQPHELKKLSALQLRTRAIAELQTATRLGDHQALLIGQELFRRWHADVHGELSASVMRESIE